MPADSAGLPPTDNRIHRQSIWVHGLREPSVSTVMNGRTMELTGVALFLSDNRQSRPLEQQLPTGRKIKARKGHKGRKAIKARKVHKAIKARKVHKEMMGRLSILHKCSRLHRLNRLHQVVPAFHRQDGCSIRHCLY